MFDVATNADCRGRRAVYQSICDTSKLAKLGNIKKTQIKHLWLSEPQVMRSLLASSIQLKGQNTSYQLNFHWRWCMMLHIFCWSSACSFKTMTLNAAYFMSTFCYANVNQSQHVKQDHYTHPLTLTFSQTQHSLDNMVALCKKRYCSHTQKKKKTTCNFYCLPLNMFSKSQFTFHYLWCHKRQEGILKSGQSIVYQRILNTAEI